MCKDPGAGTCFTFGDLGKNSMWLKQGVRRSGRSEASKLSPSGGTLGPAGSGTGFGFYS